MSGIFAGLFDPETIWIFIPLGGMAIGVIAMLMSHQQKMASIIQSSLRGGHDQEIASLRAELRELKSMIEQRSGIELPLQTGQASSLEPTLRGSME